MRQDLLLLGRYKQRFTHSFLLPKQLQINILHYLKNDFNFNEQIHIKIIFLSTNIEAIYIVIQTCKCYTEIPHSWVLFLFVNPAYVIGENVKVQESSRRFNMQANQKEKGSETELPNTHPLPTKGYKRQPKLNIIFPLNWCTSEDTLYPMYYRILNLILLKCISNASSPFLDQLQKMNFILNVSDKVIL